MSSDQGLGYSAVLKPHVPPPALSSTFHFQIARDAIVRHCGFESRIPADIRAAIKRVGPVSVIFGKDLVPQSRQAQTRPPRATNVKAIVERAADLAHRGTEGPNVPLNLRNQFLLVKSRSGPSRQAARA